MSFVVVVCGFYLFLVTMVAFFHFPFSFDILEYRLISWDGARHTLLFFDRLGAALYLLVQHTVYKT